MSESLNQKVIQATKWASCTEILIKLITPITNIILARLLAPGEFAIVTTVTMIISFADIFTDAGFQKYLVQYNFKDKEERNKHATVAFWTNLAISLILWIIIVIFSDDIAILVGNPGLGNVISVACISLPLTSFSSIQMAIYRRDFNYRILFYIRTIASIIPLVITIPLAINGYSYWSIIIGNICTNLFNSIVLTFASKWRPNIYYKFDIIKKMFSFSIWTLFESISIWLTMWVSTFIIGIRLNQYYLGLYKNSISMVNSIMSIVVGATAPILFATLSRLQNNDKEYKNYFMKFQKLASIAILPMGVGIFIYREFITNILLGSQWGEASLFIGLWGLVYCISILFGNYCSEVYRSKGKPKLSVLAQWLHLIVLVPTCHISVKYGYKILIYSMFLVRFQLIVVHLLIINYIIKINMVDMIKNIKEPMITSIIMGYIGYNLQLMSPSIVWQIISICICIFVYFSIILVFPSIRLEIIKLIRNKKIRVL